MSVEKETVLLIYLLPSFPSHVVWDGCHPFHPIHPGCVGCWGFPAIPDGQAWQDVSYVILAPHANPSFPLSLCAMVGLQPRTPPPRDPSSACL
jgi:hypothetical protein